MYFEYFEVCESLSKHNFLFCASQHVQLTSPVYNNNQGLTLWSHVMGHGSEVVG